VADGARPFVLQRGEGDSVWSLGGHFTTKLGGADAGGDVGLVEVLAYRSTEPPLHVHHREDEAWYIVDGQMTFHVDGQALVAPTGAFAFAPRGLAHAFTVDIEPTRVLVLTAPAGFERLATELGVPALSEQPPTGLALPAPDVLAEAAERYGIQIVGPPLRVPG
jgi:quercetin dioxygenase-like cupin family protein